MRPGNERGRPGRGGLDVSRGGVDTHMMTRAESAVGDGHDAVVFDAARSRAEDIARRLITATRTEREAYFAGREDGFVDGERVGFERGYRACDDEISRLQVEASRVVRAMAKLPERHRLDEDCCLLSSWTSVGDVHDVLGKDIVTRSSSREDLGGRE